jgi:trigger factor
MDPLNQSATQGTQSSLFAAQIESLSSVRRKMTIKVEAEAVNKAFLKEATKIQAKAKLRGFRPGKAPLEFVRKNFATAIQQEATNSLVSEYFHRALVQHQVPMIGEPEFEFSWPVEGSAFEFSAEFEVYPEVKVQKWEGLSGESIDISLTEADVDQSLERLREAEAKWETVERQAALGDRLKINFVGRLADAATEARDPRLSGEGLEVVLGSGQLIDGFENGLVGALTGEKRVLSLKFPDPYTAQDLAGKAVTFEVTVTQVEAKKLPELNEEFAKIFGKSTVEELREMLRKDLAQRLEKDAKKHLEDTLLKSLIQANPLEVPNHFVNLQKKHLIENFKKDYASYGFTEFQWEEYMARWDEDLSRMAKDMVHADLLIMALAKEKAWVAAEEDFQQRMQQYADQTGIDKERVISFYSDPERKEGLMSQLTREKVLTRVKEQAKIKTLSRQEWEKRSAEKT